MNLDPTLIVTVAIILFFGVGLHEYAHCKFADLAGDPTPAFYGRLTLDLTKHFEPLGTIMMFVSSISGFGLGWGRPAPMNSDKMRNPRWDFMMAVLAGPLSNVVQAVVWALLCKVAMIAGLFTADDLVRTFYNDEANVVARFFILAVQINLSMAVFNLIPLGPLDGHWIVGTFLPEKPRFYWYRWNREIGKGVLIVIILATQFAAKKFPQYDYLGEYLFYMSVKPTMYLLHIPLPS